MIRRRTTASGMAFILALVTVVMISALLSGALLLSVSHLALTHSNSSYANALNLAEAGLNWELWKISHDPTQADLTATTVQFPAGSGRSFAVHIANYPSGGTWTPPNPFWVYSTGTVDGVSRTVRIVAEGFDVYGLYALFGIDTLNVKGNATVNGAAGTNGVVSVVGNQHFNGNFWYCGSASGTDVTPFMYQQDPAPVYHSSLPEVFPTVNSLASARAEQQYGATSPQTIDFFSTHNSNATIVDGTGKPVQIKSDSLDHQTFKGTDGTIVLKPGDYYFTSLTLPSNNTIRIDDQAGVVNIWLGPDGGSGNADSINGSMLFSSQNSDNFHLYDGSARLLKLNGTMDYYGYIYAYNGPGKTGQYYGSVQLNGTGKITGSVIAYDVEKMSGNGEITFISGGGGAVPGDPIAFYGFDQAWEEMGPA